MRSCVTFVLASDATTAGGREITALGIPVLDCDVIAKEVRGTFGALRTLTCCNPKVVAPGTTGLKQLVKHFGEGILLEATACHILWSPASRCNGLSRSV